MTVIVKPNVFVIYKYLYIYFCEDASHLKTVCVTGQMNNKAASYLTLNSEQTI